jgi:hypothetical protein
MTGIIPVSYLTLASLTSEVNRMLRDADPGWRCHGHGCSTTMNHLGWILNITEGLVAVMARTSLIDSAYSLHYHE